MAAQIEIEFCRVSNTDIHSGAGGDVARLAGLLLLVGAEQARVVPFLYHNERDAGLVLRFQLERWENKSICQSLLHDGSSRLISNVGTMRFNVV